MTILMASATADIQKWLLLPASFSVINVLPHELIRRLLINAVLEPTVKRDADYESLMTLFGMVCGTTSSRSDPIFTSQFADEL